MGRPGIVVKLMLTSVVLLSIPLLVLRYFQDLGAFVLEGQRNALTLAAQAVATVLHGREDLFREAGGLPFSPWEEHSCSPARLAAPVQLDGNGRDWNVEDGASCHYERFPQLRGGHLATVSFDLRLAQRDGHLYALFRVEDDAVHFRHPRHRNLDANDHVRITIPRADGDALRLLVSAKEPGTTSAYPVGESWRYAQGDGLPEARVRGAWAESAGGYTVELRLPLDLLPMKQIGFAVADVDLPSGPLESLVGTFPTGGSERIHLVLLDSPELERILDGLELPGARISVVDDQGFVRAEVGAAPAGSTSGGATGEATTVAASPIRSGERVLGRVVVEQSNANILASSTRALERERDAMILACCAIAAVLWLFAWRLTWRIHGLRDAAAGAIDPDGRVRAVRVEAGRRAGDEIGDLSRTVSGLLERLSRYTSFLERIPRTLRHELSNPLNTLSTSLQNLVAEQPALADHKYLRSASRGVARIGEILETLTEAANLEQALRDDDLEPLCLTDLVTAYVENFAASCPERSFAIRGAHEPVHVMGSGFRVEQLLDKLFDNAVAFSPPGGEILVELHARDGGAHLSVANDGPLIPEEQREQLFDSMHSTRKTPGDDGPHLGIGLYVARRIAERLGGTLTVGDRSDSRGPVFTLALPGGVHPA